MNEEQTYQNVCGNRKYKDSLFRMVFQKEKDLLELYNAINGTDYTDPEDLEITTLENVLYIKVKNDVSFMIGCTMNLYEHQSSYNQNMPLRGFLYFAELYSIYIGQRELNLYSSALQKIPTPKYIVFYNGLTNEPDHQILKLSDAFESVGGCIECEARMLNINYGHNLELMKKCRRLEEYAFFVHTVRGYAAKKKLRQEEAIGMAIDECIQKGILLDVLIGQRAEVIVFVLEKFDEELYERDLKTIAYEQGEKAGEEKKLRDLVQKKLSRGKCAEEIADALEESVESICQIIAELEQK